jgi:RNA polymerase sigma-70 factor (ECF subfamily)
LFKFASSPEFVQGFRSGDRDVLERIYVAYVDEVAGIVRACLARTMAGGWAAEMEDLVHEVFARAFSGNARRSFEGTAEYGAYLGGIARNLVATWARRRRREPVNRHPDADPHVPQPEPDSEPQWADAETMTAVERYLRELPVELRQVHEQRYVKCLSQEAVCQALGLSRQQLRTREKHLREGLQRELARANLRSAAPPLAKTAASESEHQEAKRAQR